MPTIEILKHTIDYWYEDGQEMPLHEEEHVSDMIFEGYSSGELIDHNERDEMNTGWWKIICPYCKARKEVE